MFGGLRSILSPHDRFWAEVSVTCGINGITTAHTAGFPQSDCTLLLDVDTFMLYRPEQ